MIKHKKINLSEEEPTKYQKQFLDWLDANPTKKKDLIEWKEVSKIIDNDKIDENKTLEIDFTKAIHLSRKWKNIKDRFLEYWRVLHWWAVTEKHDFSLGNNFHEWDYFIRHYQNSTEELVTRIKELESKNKQLENKVTKLEEELEIERETNQESAEMMDNFYRTAPPRDKKRIQELESMLEINEKLTNLRTQEEQTEEQVQVPPK